MGGFFAGLGSAVGGAGSQAPALREQMLTQWSHSRDALANMIAQARENAHDQNHYNELLDIESGLRTAQPGSKIQPFAKRAHEAMVVHPESIQLMQQTGILPGPKKPPQTAAGPPQPGQTPGALAPMIVGPPKDQSAALGGTSPVEPTGKPIGGLAAAEAGAGQHAGVPETPPINMLPPPQAAAPPEALPIQPIDRGDPDAEFHRQWATGFVTPATSKAHAPYEQHEAELAKSRAAWAFRLQQLRDSGVDVSKMTPEALGLTAPINLKPGETATSLVTGKTLAEGAPRLEVMPEGSRLSVIGGSGGGGQGQQIQSIEGPPPKLDTNEGMMISAAQQVAAEHGIPFDPNKNPRNPLAQIPNEYKDEVTGRYEQSRMDPGMRQARLENMASLRQGRVLLESLRNIQIENASHARGDRSYAASDRELGQLSKPVTDLMTRMTRLQDTLAQGTPEADALVAPELLSIIAGGAGSGLRMTEPEISRVIGGRSAWENLRANIQHWSLDPKAARSLTPEQVQQIHALVGAVSGKLNQKMETINGAYQGLLSSENPQDHRKIIIDARKKLVEVDQGKSGGGTSTIQPIGGPSGGGGTIPYSANGRTYNIPADQEAAFLKDHPNAKKVQGAGR